MSIKNIYWSRNLGEFVNKETGEVTLRQTLVPRSMNMEDWLETLVMVIGDYPRLPLILTSETIEQILKNSYTYIHVDGELPEEVFLGPARMVGEIIGKEVWVDSQMEENILHLFSSKETFDKERVSIHVLGSAT